MEINQSRSSDKGSNWKEINNGEPQTNKLKWKNILWENNWIESTLWQQYSRVDAWFGLKSLFYFTHSFFQSYFMKFELSPNHNWTRRESQWSFASCFEDFISSFIYSVSGKWRTDIVVRKQTRLRPGILRGSLKYPKYSWFYLIKSAVLGVV